MDLLISYKGLDWSWTGSEGAAARASLGLIVAAVIEVGATDWLGEEIDHSLML